MVLLLILWREDLSATRFCGSGMARHRDVEGFKVFSNPRGIMELESRRLFSHIMPPYDQGSVQLVITLFGTTKDKLKLLGMLLKNNLASRLGGS